MPKSADKPMKWTAATERALALVFSGRWTQDEIVGKLADEFGSEKFRISTRTLRAWIEHPDFQARLAALRADFEGSLRDVTFADKARRILALDAAAKIALRELEERTLLKEVRPTKDGFITNEAFNHAAMSEFRAALDDIAKELGHRKHIAEVTGKDGGPIQISNARERLAARLDALAARRGAASAD